MRQFLSFFFLRHCFFLGFSFLIGTRSSGQYYAASVYKEEPGMTSNRIYGMVQTPTGEMWFATQEGINVYDGLEWSAFPDSMRFLPYNGHVRITTGPDSSVYLLGVNNQNFDLKKHKNNQCIELDLPADLADLRTPKNFEIAIRSNKLVITHGHTIYEYREGKWTKDSVELKSGKAYIHKIRALGDSLWMATDQGLLLYQDNRVMPILEGVDVFDFYLDQPTNTFYLLGVDWVGSLHQGEFRKIRSGEVIGLTGKNPLSFINKRAGRLFYSMNSPVYSHDFKSGKRQLILSNSYKKDYTCMQGFFDNEDNLWVATLRGVFKIANLDIYSYNKTQLTEDEVSAILEASNGDIFLGNNFGFNILKPDGQIELHQLSSDILQHRIMDIVEFEGVVYMAGHTAGIITYKDGKRSYELIEGNKSRALDLHIYKNKLYAASSSRVYERTATGWKQVAATGTLEGVNQPIIRKIFWNDDHKYLLTPYGVYDCDRDKYYTSDQLDETNVYTAIRYQGEVLLGTTAGVAEIKGDAIVPSYNIPDPLKQPVYSFLVDREHRLWVGTERGIYHKSKYNPSIYINHDNGLIGNEVNRNAFVQLNDGRILIGTDEGLSIYTPNRERKLPQPLLQLSEITANDAPIQSRTLSARNSQLNFNFKGISFYDERMINYRTKLVGFDKAWQYLPYHTQRTASYTNLPPGEYRFLVQARVGDGEWSLPVHSGLITVRPEYYDTNWFRLLIVFGLMAIIFALVRFRSQHLKNRNLKLQERIGDKTKTLHEQNLELMEAISKLKNTQGQLIQSEKLASMGHLTAGIAHEMNNPLNYIRGGAECLKQNLAELNEITLKVQTAKNGEVDCLKKEYEYLMLESQQLIESILNGAEKSTHIVKSLSSFTADAQNFYSFVELENEVNTALTLLNNQIGFRITINKFFGNVPRLECYPAKINQMLVNLMLNAIQAIEDEGEITIRIYRKDIKHLALEIIDTGAGVDLEDDEKVFEPFFTTKDNNPGLGLTIVKSIVQDHNGQIRFLSKRKKGTKVIVILPLQQTFHPELELE